MPLNAKVKTVYVSALEKSATNFKTRLLNVCVCTHIRVCVCIGWTLLFQDTWTGRACSSPSLSPKFFTSHMHRFGYVSMQLIHAIDISPLF